MIVHEAIDQVREVLGRARDHELARLVEIVAQEISRRDTCAGHYLTRGLSAFRGWMREQQSPERARRV
jgi:hypothetical protein